MAAPDRASSGGLVGWQVATLRGVPVIISRSWLMVAVVIVLLFGPRLEAQLPTLGVLAYLVAGLYAVLLLLSVLVHEAAHALVGQRVGYRVQRIVANLWGGHTAYDHGNEQSPGASALVAVVGPLANGAMAGLGWVLLPAAPNQVIELLLIAFTWSNAFVGIFNLLPGLPLDGGFLVEAVVWRLTGSRSRGTIVAGWAGRAAAVILVGWFAVLPLLQGTRPPLVTVVGVLFIAMFMWLGATSSIRSAQGAARISGVRLEQITIPVRVVDDRAPLSQVPDGVAVVASPERGLWGLIDAQASESVPDGERRDVATSAVAVAQPQGWVVDVIDPYGDILPVISALRDLRAEQVIVTYAQGTQIAGLVRAQDMLDALSRANRRS
ncbi:site-2 protease family protein [Demetria terragena]|uniref:site-2 protease family protein n=1 Tax=Demetria terragena TaxID=63959 RepID=UPI000379ADEA|nr:site-2 protease family protein [Demetria terragena]